MNKLTSITLFFLCFLWSIQGKAQTQDSVVVTQETTVKTTNDDIDDDNDDEYETRSRVGLRAGVVISKQQFDQGDLDVNPDSKFGLDLALIAEFPLGENFALSPEFHWMQKGSKIEDINGGFPESTSTLNYLEIPVLAKFTFGDEAAFNVFFGPSVGYLFSATDKDGDGNTNDIDLEDFNRTELGAHLGAGIRLGPVVLDVRYILGFSNIANIDEDDDLEIHNRSYGAGLSIMF
ncbi:MAG TPA: porin family protein [Saprospiraceae bacterium]|nr:porin family protein [Saprospiraceae bacterium]